MMSSETGETVTVRTEGSTGASAAGDQRAKGCPLSEHHVHREDVWKIMKECREESFWYRALPASVASMAVTGGLIYNGNWKSSPRFGPFPKLIVAGILGFCIGRFSYAPTCMNKFQALGLNPREGGPWGFGGPWRSGPGHRPGCEEHKKKEAPAAEQPQA